MTARALGPTLIAAAIAGLGAPACRRAPGAPPPFTAPVTLGGRNVSTGALEHGRDVYTHFCRPCHGDAGDGKGPAAGGLRPPPRDLRLGVYKFAAVAAGQLPRDADFVRTLRHGLHGTAMLSWDVPDAEVEKRAIGFGCEVILCLTSPRALQALLRDAGYLKSNETYLLMKKGVPVPDHLDDWYFTFSDHDAF